MIVSTDPETNYQILQQEGKSFELCYTESFMTITGESFPGQHGLIHKYLKNLVLQIIGPETLKDKLLAHMDIATRIYMHSWANSVIVDLKEVASNVKYFLTYCFIYIYTHIHMICLYVYLFQPFLLLISQIKLYSNKAFTIRREIL